MIKCCIFDLDGTILDTITTITYYVNKTLQNHGIGTVTEDECRYFAGNGARALITRALNSKGITDEERIERILLEYTAAYDEAPLHLTAAFDGIIELVGKLKERGLRLAVLSNKPDFAVKSVVAHFFGDSFDSVLGGRDGVPLKPDPTVPLQIAETLGISPCEVAWIGDTSTDMETGKNLGAGLNIGVLWGFRPRAELVGAGADVTVSSADALLAEIIKVS